MNTNEWQIVHNYQSCIEQAEQIGFKVEQSSEGYICIVANKAPYVIGTKIKYCHNFAEAKLWIEGYQHAFEMEQMK